LPVRGRRHEGANARLGDHQPGLAHLLDGHRPGQPVDAPLPFHLRAARDLRANGQFAADDHVADNSHDLQVDAFAGVVVYANTRHRLILIGLIGHKGLRGKV
jgi:hypothetical protein